MLFIDYSWAFSTIMSSRPGSKLWGMNISCSLCSWTWTSWQTDLRWLGSATSPHPHWHLALVPHRDVCSAPCCTLCTYVMYRNTYLQHCAKIFMVDIMVSQALPPLLNNSIYHQTSVFAGLCSFSVRSITVPSSIMRDVFYKRTQDEIVCQTDCMWTHLEFKPLFSPALLLDRYSGCLFYCLTWPQHAKYHFNLLLVSLPDGVSASWTFICIELVFAVVLKAHCPTIRQVTRKLEPITADLRREAGKVLGTRESNTEPKKLSHSHSCLWGI